MASVQIRGIKKQFGSTQVIRGVDIDIADGEFAVLVGPSGCGKSTLLRMLAGLEEITEGEISIGGTVVNNVQPKDRDIAMVFQNYALYPHMTVNDNMAFSLMLAKKDKSFIQQQVKKAAEILGLTALLERYPRQLSGGQRQRVAMGRAIVRDPQVFLFDEPLSNLDAKLRVEMRAEIKRMHQRLGSTIVYVTHDQIEAMTLGDRIAVMKDGVVQQFGSPQEIYDSPSNLFVAGFIGSPSMNFLRGKLTTDGTAPAFELEHGGQKTLLSLPLNGNADAVSKWVGRDIVLGIRPEHVTDAMSARNGDPLSNGHGGNYRPTEVSCTVELTEPTGPDTLVVARFNDAPVTCRTHPRAGALPNEPLKLAFDLTKALLFDPASEQRIA